MQSKKTKWVWGLVVVFTLAAIAPLLIAGESKSEGEKKPETATSQQQPTDGKVAIVNGTVISQQEFDKEMGRVQKHFLMMGKFPDEAQMEEMKKEILKTLVGRELLVQESEKQKIQVSADDVEKQLAKMKERYPSDVEFKKALEKASLSENDLKVQIKKGLKIQKLIEQKFTQNINVPDEKVKNYYADNIDKFKKPEQVKASHILVKLEKGADKAKKEEAHKKIKDIEEKLKKGGDFGALAKEFSECPSASVGGDLGFFGRGQMVKPFEEVAFNLKKDEISNIVETQFGYHLIKLLDKKPESTIPFEDVKDRIGKFLQEEESHKQVEKYVDQLQEKSKVEIFLK